MRLILVVMSLFVSSCEKTLDANWEKIHTVGNSTFTSLEVCQDGIVIAGHSVDMENKEFFLLKLNNSGERKWKKSYRSPDMMHVVWDMEVNTDGEIVICGFAEADQAGEKGSAEIFAMKTDSAGSEVWRRYVGGSGYDVGVDVEIVGKEEGYAFVGTTEDSDADIIIFRLDQRGDVLWKRIYDTTEDESAYALAVNPDATLVIGARAGHIMAQGTTFLLKVDKAGDVLWKKNVWRGGGDTHIRQLRRTKDGGYVVVGTVYQEGRRVVFASRTDSSGCVVWEKAYRPYGHSAGHVILERNDGGYLVGASVSGLADGLQDFCFLRIDNSGNVASTRRYRGGFVAFVGLKALERDRYVLATNRSSSAEAPDELVVTELAP